MDTYKEKSRCNCKIMNKEIEGGELVNETKVAISLFKYCLDPGVYMGRRGSEN